ncbi:MAG: serine hydrolase domain-containing protein [Nitrospirota bacterium]
MILRSNIAKNKTAVIICIIAAIQIFAVVGCSTMPVRPLAIKNDGYEYTRRYASWLIKKEMKKYDVPGLSIALVDENHLIFAEGFGYADIKEKVKATPETVYRVGSISKLFTAVAVMQLAEAGKIDIDKPLKDYLPEFSIKTRFSNAGHITPRNIMTHHSGLPANLYKGLWTNDPRAFTRIAGMLKDEHTSFPPDLIFSYSNIGVTLLGQMVEKVSNREFTSYMDESVLQPFGMVHSSFAEEKRNEKLLAKGYNKGIEYDEPPLRDIPASSLYSNVIDLAGFMQVILSEGMVEDTRVLNSETITDMLTPQNNDVPLDFDFKVGLGWFLDDIGTRIAYHGGQTLTFTSYLAILPEHKLGVAVLANSSTGFPAVQEIAEDILNVAIETQTGIKKKTEPERDYPSVVILPIKKLRGFEGTYSTETGLATVYLKKSKLFASFNNKSFQLLPVGDGRFTIKPILFGLFPVSQIKDVEVSIQEISGRRVIILNIKGKRYLFGEKINMRPIPNSWLARLGTYKVTNQDELFPIGDVTLLQKDGLLFLDYEVGSRGKTSLPLLTLSDSEAIVAGIGSNKGETIRIIMADGEEVLTYSGYEARRIGD